MKVVRTLDWVAALILLLALVVACAGGAQPTWTFDPSISAAPVSSAAASPSAS